MGTRSRTLKYLPGHQLRFGIAAVSRDPATGDVEEAVCLFCKHFGREQRADKKRKSASTVKYFRDSFRPDQYAQHHQLQHPTQWTKYKDARARRCFDVKASIVEVVAVLATQLDFLMEMAAGGLSGAQIAASVKVFRQHAPMLLRDLVENTKKTGPTSKKNVAMAVEREQERAKEILRVDGDVTPEYNEAQTAEFVRLGVAASLSIIARLMEESWAFSLELGTVAQHPMYWYLDVKVRLYNRIGGLRSAHLLAIPEYVGKCDSMMCQTLDRVLTALLLEWKNKLLGIITAGDIPFPARLSEVIKHFQNAAKGSVLYRTSNCINQLQRVLLTCYASIDSGNFLLTLKKLSEYVRKEPRVLSEMKRLPGYWQQLDSKVHCDSSTPVAFGQEIDMLVAHSGFLQEHLKEVAFSSETALKIPVSWWVGLQVLQWVTARANAVFEVLEKQHVTISQQATVMASLAEECITGFHAQIHENRSSVSQTGSIEYISLDKRVSLSKTNLVEFVISSSELARDMGKHGGGATVNAASEHFAMGAVNMIASLVELSVSLKQQCAACSNVSGRVSQTTVVADVLPPVMPHELVQLNSDEFDELLEAHDTSSRGTLKDDDIKAEHELLCCTFAKDGDLRIALEMCTQGTPFDVAWSLMDARFKSLEAFAGGLATVCPSNVVPLSATSARDLVLCPKDMEEARLLLADFELESALHAQQFQSLTKLQEEIYDREVAERRFFATPKDSLVAAALEASMRSVRLCNDNANAFSLEEHQRWCAERVKERVVLKVSAPEARGSYLQKHTTYLVTQESHQEGVRRRFRDFEWLHVVLHARYVGLLIPSLPEKTTTAAVLKSNTFMQSRMRGLQRFLNDIIQSPYLRSDAAVARFLGEPGDEATWEAMRKSTAVMDNAGEGHMRWLQRIMCEHIASSPETYAWTVQECCYGQGCEHVARYLRGWQLAETGTGSFETRNDGPLVALLDKSTTTISGWSQVESFQPAIYELLLLENVKYMLHQATAMKQMLIERERAVAGESSPEQKPSPPSSESQRFHRRPASPWRLSRPQRRDSLAQ
ncbi:Phox homologous domain [Phytophthora cactorum]|nr:Phox homologous domain [Phytophthora cactorum]